MFYPILAIVIIFLLITVVNDIRNQKKEILPFLNTSLAMIFGVGFIFFLSISYKFELYDGKGNLDMATTGQIGDFLGGILGLLIGGISIFLLYKTLHEQLNLNSKQKKDLAIERFGNKFYQMLQIHRGNVQEISIGKNVSGRKAFARLFLELKFTYFFCNNYISKKTDQQHEEPSKELIFNTAYLVFFYGIGQISTKLVLDIVNGQSKHVNLFQKFVEEAVYTQKKYRSRLFKIPLSEPINQQESIRYYFDHIPFQGHSSNLSHYVRHLFQFVRFVDEEYPKIDDDKSKIEGYITIIRSQLSIYEQAFLFYNSLSVLGTPWIENKNGEDGLLRKHKVIKSLPKPLADFYKTPDEIFGTNKYNEDDNILFEWTEIKKRFTEIGK